MTTKKLKHLISSTAPEGEEYLSLEDSLRLTDSKLTDDEVVIVSEKLDGQNFTIKRGYRRGSFEISACATAPELFQLFLANNAARDRLSSIVGPFESADICWLATARSTRYQIKHEFPVVITNLYDKTGKNLPFDEMFDRCLAVDVPTPYRKYFWETLARTPSKTLREIKVYGGHGALDEINGVVYRLENKRSRNVILEGQWIRPEAASKLRWDSEGLPTWWNIPDPEGFLKDTDEN